jgi:Putative addiction module component
MSRADKLCAMEGLWADLTKDQDKYTSPAWHFEERARTEAEILTSRVKFVGWGKSQTVDSSPHLMKIFVSRAAQEDLLARRFPFAVSYKIERRSVRVRRVLDCRSSPAWMRNKLK